MWTKEKVASTIDHAILKPLQTRVDVAKECEIANKWKVASVCVKPQHVKIARTLVTNGVKVGTVINFPYGMDTIEVQQEQARKAIIDGADELDIVMNLADLELEEYSRVHDALKQTIDYARSHKEDVVIKVIFETCNLNVDQVIKACEISREVKADFVKTSTGFGKFGANISTCQTMINAVGDVMGVKASGGIKDLSTLISYLIIGCTRIGTSSTDAILKELEGAEK